ncbi:unnamed protein product [Didymodactylos carnosus]|uniref:CBM1 domain-containing protein n=2 Tax=Didymodactylos carnosus TaxID=1234261 RepID=A0A814SFI8_9BILA|nr:unnamed protein product [Didymodactylos carnosus]CAF3909369.1 unnamed protein product [Didymodactylos carnosus]
MITMDSSLIPPTSLISSYYNSANIVPSQNSQLVDEFGQCGGLQYEGPRTCKQGLVCFKRSKYYSQCIGKEVAAIAAIPIQYIALGGRCGAGKDARSPFLCAVGTYCFIQNENYGECRTSCPLNWFCQKQTLPEWAPCGGETYIGLTKCKEGLQCYSHSKWYSECRSECPEGWKC